MVMIQLQGEIVEYDEFNEMIDDFIKIFGSAKAPLTSLMTYWHAWNKANIFNLKSPGKYEDLSEAYKDFKEAAVGFIYPILKFDGVLEASLTTRNSAYSVAEIGDDYLIMGTNAQTIKGAPYALYLQRGTKKMPARPPIIKGVEQLDSLARVFFETTTRMMNAVQGLKGKF